MARNGKWRKYDLGDIVYALHCERDTPLIVECTVERILGSDNYSVYDMTNNIMLERHSKDLVSEYDMIYSMSEFMHAKSEK